MKQQFTFIAIFILCFFQACLSTNTEPEITKEELYGHIEFLASDSLKGRLPGTPEDKITAEYIASQFKNIGLELLFESGLQNFEIPSKLNMGDNNSLTILNESFNINTDFTPIPFSASTKLESEVVFTGHGFNIDNPNYYWNDYANIDVKGKWVLILRGEPDITDSPVPFSMFSSLRSKAITAKDMGAAGVIFVSGENFDTDDKLIELDKVKGKLDIPVIHIKRNIANIILKKSGKTIEDLENEIALNSETNSFNTETIINCQTDIFVKKEQTFNVIAQLIVNPDIKDYIVIGAHYDHLGFGGLGSGSRAPNENRPHYGADDNASGVSAVIEIAEKLVSKKDSLKNNFLFVAFGAEELGLIGSKYFTNNLPIDDSIIKTMINIDMVGRMKEDTSLQIGGVGTSLEGEALLNDLNLKYNFKLGFSHEGYGPSDHSSFYSKDIPVFFFSTGPHIDYHTPGDSLENINFEGLKLISDYIYDFSFDLSSMNKLLTYQEAGPKMPNGDYQKTKFKVTLGIMPDFSSVEKRGLRADLVIKDKPAYKAGMQTGDIITAINGYPVGDVYEYMERLSKLEAGQIITVEVIRNDKKEVLIVQL